MKRSLVLFWLIGLLSCRSDDDVDVINGAMYFPPIDSEEWQTVSPASLGWNETVLPSLNRFIDDTGTRALLILKNGRIVYERYGGLTLAGTDRFSQDSYWYWASAGKTLTAFMVGRAEAAGLLSLDAPSNTYLGEGWSQVNPEQENAITVRHHLTMTTGLDYTVAEPDCTDPECLRFLNAPGSTWYYHNAPYTLLDQVLEGAANQTFDTYFQQELSQKIGMEGFWEYIGYNNVFFSPARSMARFGLMILAEGTWDGTPILENESFYRDMINPSQEINPSYGYLWWLNGKGSIIPPGVTSQIPIDMAPEAPADMYAALGRNGQLINIVPSQGLVIIRTGHSTDDNPVPFSIQNQLWEILNELIVN